MERVVKCQLPISDLPPGCSQAHHPCLGFVEGGFACPKTPERGEVAEANKSIPEQSKPAERSRGCRHHGKDRGLDLDNWGLDTPGEVG
jgi:hypothetical protein